MTPLERYCAFFEQFGPDSLDGFGTIYAEDARFRDPFNDLRGLAAIRHLFAHGLEQCPGMRFEILLALSGEHDGQPVAMIRWRMRCATRGRNPLAVEGCTTLRFDDRGRVVDHVDDWDPAGQLYERVPLLGSLMRLLRRRLAAR
ncbi:MAG: nuclear transport factor 2 family protein [Halothiobacillaceae bacterium]